METKIQQHYKIVHYKIVVQYSDGSGEVFTDCTLPLVTDEMAERTTLTFTKNTDGTVVVINFKELRKFQYIYEEPEEVEAEIVK